MKMTLLEMTQNILSAINGDEVNSIGDSVEALQVAEEIKTAYYNMVQNPYGQETFNAVIQLRASQDTDKPTHMTIPPNVEVIEWVKYNHFTESKPDWREVCYMAPDEFLARSFNLSQQDDVLEVTDDSGAVFYVKTNENPKYYTSFDEQTLIFDGYDNDLDTTLQESKTVCWGKVIPNFQMEDDFIPSLRIDMFPTLLADAKSSVFVNFKQVSNAREERRYRKGLTGQQINHHRLRERQSDSRGSMNYGRPKPSG